MLRELWDESQPQRTPHFVTGLELEFVRKSGVRFSEKDKWKQEARRLP